jgi:hypothetical protein
MNAKRTMGATALAAVAFIVLSGRAGATPVDAEPLGGKQLWGCDCVSKCRGVEASVKLTICDTRADVNAMVKAGADSCVAKAAPQCPTVTCASSPRR